MIFAPAIVLQRGENVADDLIAGHTMEINALTDIVITASLGQLQLCSLLVQEVLAAQRVLNFKSGFGRHGVGSTSSDSGVDCDHSAEASGLDLNHKKPVKLPPTKFVPFEILVTGRTISTSFHRVQPYKGDVGKDPQQAVSWRKLKLRSFRRNTFAESMADESDSSGHLLSKPKTKQARGVIHEGGSMDLGYDASEEGM